MTNKTSIRFFDDVPVRAVWNEEDSKWWFCAQDIVSALTESRNPRDHWAAVKRRNPELAGGCIKLKMKADDGKSYNTDVIDERGLNYVIALVPSRKTEVFSKWMKNMESGVDEKSRPKAYEHFESGFIDNIKGEPLIRC